jgi:CheY-like chemotaxis protein
MTSDAFAEKLKAMRGKYLETVDADHATLAALLVRCDEGEDTEALRSDIRNIAHRMAGTGGSFGFADISDWGKRLEEKIYFQKNAPIDDIRMMTAALAEACQSALSTRDESPIAHAAPEKVAQVVQTGETILIADDDKSICALLSEGFTEAGYSVACVVDGKQAWECLLSQDYALAVLDYTMPGYDGMTLLNMLKENTKTANMPVVFLTARDNGSAVLEGLESGAAEYISKPFKAETVVECCVKLLADKRSSA